jgi:deazaflavin-dependent oxidoreductase (nitroreductase family)
MAMFAQRVHRMPYAELEIVGRSTRQQRRTVLTLFVVDDQWYVGHPNGQSQWVRNLTAANSAVVIKANKRTTVKPFELVDGGERDKVVRATSQQPFPAGLVYRAGRAHVQSVGSYFRLEPYESSS